MSSRRIILIGIIGLCLVGILGAALVGIVVQLTHPAITPRLQMEVDIPLPGAFPDAFRTKQNPLAPGVATSFDHFDFMGLDYQTHLLFIAHSGPSPDVEQLVNPKFNIDTDAKTDGNIVIFNTVKKKVVGLLDIPQVAGIVVAPDLHKVFAADSNDNIIYAIDERTFKYTPIQLQANDSPDALTYDQTDHLLLVSNPGTPATPDSNIIERKNQNETIIDARAEKVVGRIALGVDGQWGDDVGHVKYDAGLRRAFVVVQQLPDLNSPNQYLLPPPGTAYLVEFDPVAHKIITRVHLPSDCITPHGMAIDTSQHVAFIACVDEDPPSLIRFDLRTLRVIPEQAWPVAVKPDMVVLDSSLHLVYVACGAGISIFQENGRSFKWLATYTYGTSTHSLVVNEQTQEVYLPLVREGGRPVLRIMRYDPDGT